MAYVYRHIRKDKNEPFYIGIGKDDGGEYIRAHQKASARGNSIIWKRIAEKTEYEVEILLDNLEWKEAGKKEIEFIKLYGRIDRSTGTLANLTDGGDGNLGLIHSAESLKKIGEATKNRVGYWKGKKMSEHIIKASADAKRGKPSPMRGKNISEKTKEAVRKHATGNKYCVGRVISQETRDKISQSNMGKKSWLIKGEKWPSHIPHTCIGRKYSEKSIQKIKDSQKSSKPVDKYSLDGMFIQSYPSIAEAARQNNVFATGVWGCCKGIKNVKKYKGFIWKYKTN